ncbi:MAG: complex I NDUFA9 subunit family protein [Pseudomonadota bacterium]
MRGKLAVVFGGSGFVGRHVVRELSKRGWRVRVAVRRPHHAQFLRPMGDVGQIQLFQANIRNRKSIADALKDADAVVNCVGIASQRGQQRFQAVHAEGARLLVDEVVKSNISSFVQLSAIGADEKSDSLYARSKGLAERVIKIALPSSVILRPSVIFGPEDQFFNRLAEMAVSSPVLPLIGGGRSRIQPVYVDDIADAVCTTLEDVERTGCTYELGGPKVYTLKALVELVLHEIQRSRIILPIPFASGPILGLAGEAVALLPFGSPPITRDQVRLLRQHNTVSDDADTFRDLGIEPVTVEAILPTYMVMYRRYGQFAEKSI